MRYSNTYLRHTLISQQFIIEDGETQATALNVNPGCCMLCVCYSWPFPGANLLRSRFCLFTPACVQFSFRTATVLCVVHTPSENLRKHTCCPKTHCSENKLHFCQLLVDCFISLPLSERNLEKMILMLFKQCWLSLANVAKVSASESGDQQLHDPLPWVSPTDGMNRVFSSFHPKPARSQTDYWRHKQSVCAATIREGITIERSDSPSKLHTMTNLLSVLSPPPTQPPLSLHLCSPSPPQEPVF